MGVVKVKVVKAVNLMNMDFGLSGKTDAYVTVFAGGQWFQTPVIKDNLNPEWNQEFRAEVADTDSAVVFFNVFDADNWTNDAFVGGTAVSLATLNANEPKTFELPLLRREKELGWGTLVVELTAVDFTGLAGVVQSLNEAEKKRSAHVTELTAEVDALKSKLTTLQEASQKLESELHKSHGEKSQLESTIKGIEEQANWKLFTDSPNGIHFTSIATGQNLRINPEAVPNVHGLGGDGVWATWLPEKQADQLYKFKNKQTGGYLRIDPTQKITEAGGAGGKYCVFRVHWVDKAKLIVALESTEFPSQHVGILPTGQAKNPAETGRGIHGQFTVKVHV